MRTLGITIIVLTVVFLGGYGLWTSDILSDKPTQSQTQQIQHNDSKQNTKDTSKKIQKNEKSISEDEAKNIAVADANVQPSEVYNSWVKKMTNRNIDFYDVDFIAGNKKYEYKILADNGEIDSIEYEIEKSAMKNLQGNPVSEQEAKELILQQIPDVNGNNMQIKRDKEDNRFVYEFKIRQDNVEYEASVDADTGTIIEWKMDKNIIR